MEEQRLCGSGRAYVGRGNIGATNAESVATDEQLVWIWRRMMAVDVTRRRAIKTFQRTKATVGG